MLKLHKILWALRFKCAQVLLSQAGALDFFGLESMHRAHPLTDYLLKEKKMTVLEMHKNITQGNMVIQT